MSRLTFGVALTRNGGDPSGWPAPKWTLEEDRAINAEIGVKSTVLSITAPGAAVESDPKAAASLARKLNDMAAAIRDGDPEHYGFFAALPNLLNTKDCLAEIAYALDQLEADGVTLFTRYGKDNHYLGHADFRPVWEELSRRNAVVFVHPTHAVDTNLVSKVLPQPMFDYPHETGRTAMDLILSDTLRTAASGCKIILSHAGGTLPWLASRPLGMLPYTPFDVGKTSNELMKEARSFYFDTALSTDSLMLDLLKGFAKPGHILFGSDFPYAPREGIKVFTKKLEDYQWKQDDEWREVERGGAEKLFPRFASKE